jgi:hypothetical protein
LLNQEEIGRLVHYKIPVNHKDHVHIDIQHALKGLEDETFDLVDLGDGKHAVTRTKMYFLRRTKSCGVIDIVQRVVSNQLEHLMPLR